MFVRSVANTLGIVGERRRKEERRQQRVRIERAERAKREKQEAEERARREEEEQKRIEEEEERERIEEEERRKRREEEEEERVRREEQGKTSGRMDDSTPSSNPTVPTTRFSRRTGRTREEAPPASAPGTAAHAKRRAEAETEFASPYSGGIDTSQDDVSRAFPYGRSTLPPSAPPAPIRHRGVVGL